MMSDVSTNRKVAKTEGQGFTSTVTPVRTTTSITEAAQKNDDLCSNFSAVSVQEDSDTESRTLDVEGDVIKSSVNISPNLDAVESLETGVLLLSKEEMQSEVFSSRRPIDDTLHHGELMVESYETEEAAFLPGKKRKKSTCSRTSASGEIDFDQQEVLPQLPQKVEKKVIINDRSSVKMRKSTEEIEVVALLADDIYHDMHSNVILSIKARDSIQSKLMSPVTHEKNNELSENNQIETKVMQPLKNFSKRSKRGQEEDPELNTRCGVGPCHPSWMQRLANNKTYVALHGFIGMNSFALAAYYVAIISTVEKRFKIPSRTTGVITSAWDIGSLLSVMTLGYLGGRGHKTRYVAFGTIFVALSSFIRLVPHILYGPGQDAIELTLEYSASIASVHATNKTNGTLSLCGNIADIDEDCSTGSATSWPAVIFFIAQFMLGIGSSVYYTLGSAYLDDNTRKNKAPLLLATTQCMRMLGPTFGFALASYALSQYVDRTLHPIIDNEDPRWIGAWWLYWSVFGGVASVLAGIMFLFPKELPKTTQRKALQLKPTIKRQKSFKDFRMTFSDMIHNKVLLYNTFSAVCFVFGYTGYWTFMPKYMETQYRQSASRASLISGSVGLIFMGLGIVSSAVIITKFRPRPRYLAAWSVIVEGIDVIGHFSWIFLSCDPEDMHGSWSEDNSWNLTDTCNSACDCGPTIKYSPICSVDGNTSFYSPCHAGCTSSDFINGTKLYSNCSCLAGGQAVDGLCDVDCTTNFILFLATQCIMRFLSSSGKAGNTLIQFRCVDEEDKALAMAFSEFLLSGLAFIPAPIVYGMILDSACLVWGQTCGQSGNCWLYDSKSIRLLLNCTGAGCLLCGMLLDIGVWYHVDGLKIYDEDGKVNKDPGSQKDSTQTSHDAASKN